MRELEVYSLNSAEARVSQLMRSLLIQIFRKTHPAAPRGAEVRSGSLQKKMEPMARMVVTIPRN